MPTFTEDQQEDKLNPGQQHADILVYNLSKVRTNYACL